MKQEDEYTDKCEYVNTTTFWNRSEKDATESLES
jgi:hypothetical protein